jgi:DNA-binding GntR family transcriptional regulator
MHVNDEPPAAARDPETGVPARVEKHSLSEIEAPAAPADPTRGASLTDRAYGDIEEMIVTLRLQPGEVLSETTLSQRLGIGRTPVREALQRLAREGLVTVLPRRGILVSEFNVKSQLRMLEVRREIERLLARVGAERATAEERRHFVSIAEGMEHAARENDDISFIRLDHDLNARISAAAHNEYASRAIGLLHGLSRRFWYMHYKAAADLPLCARLHAELARRIAEGDADGAARASDRLVDYAETFTRATVSPRPSAVAR